MRKFDMESYGTSESSGEGKTFSPRSPKYVPALRSCESRRLRKSSSLALFPPCFSRASPLTHNHAFMEKRPGGGEQAQWYFLLVAVRRSLDKGYS